MLAYTMNHLSTDAINEMNSRERDQRLHHEHYDEAMFIIRLTFILASFVLPVVMF